MYTEEYLELIDYMREEPDRDTQIKCLFDIVESILKEMEGI